jgi:putative peptidoglycan lipid II flippase
MAVNMVFNLMLVIPFHYLWQIGHVGLALATSLAAFLNAGLLYRGLRKQGVYQPMLGWGAYLLRLLFANGLMVVVLLGSFFFVSDWSVLSLWERVAGIAVICGLGLTVYLLALLAVGLRLRHFRR